MTYRTHAHPIPTPLATDKPLQAATAGTLSDVKFMSIQDVPEPGGSTRINPMDHMSTADEPDLMSVDTDVASPATDTGSIVSTLVALEERVDI